MKEALYYKQLVEEKKVQCELCPHYCVLAPGETGICRARMNRNNQENKLYSLNYGQVTSTSMDPIEKKPLYHFHPGSSILSLGTWGCNFRCPFCQNWQISQEKPATNSLSPRQIIELAHEKNSMGLAYTYSEPLIWYEFVRETAELAHKADLKNILVTNGYINREPLEELLPFIDAANVDLKAFDNSFYREQCQGQQQPVLENIELLSQNIHLELTTLVITDLNDDLDQMKELLTWIHKLDSRIPLHLSRYFPSYKSNKPPTSLSKMKSIYELATDYLEYVYLGNTGLAGYNNTVCSDCGKELIIRDRYRVSSRVEDGCCPECGEKLAGEF